MNDVGAGSGFLRHGARLAAILVLCAASAHASPAGDGLVATLWDAWSVADGLRCNRMASDLGARQISYLVHLRQRDRRAAAVYWYGTRPGEPLERAPGFDALRIAVADAHTRGLSVTLVPFLRAESGTQRHRFWPDDREAWFRSYGARLQELARFAERNGVGELLVGSELTLLYRDTARWRALIRRVRRVFSGHLTASAQFWTYPLVGFWDALDSVGVSGYFRLVPWRGIRSTALMERLWRAHKAALLAFCRARGKPLTFCEVGYPATDVAAFIPWDFTWERRHYDPALQARCFEAFRRVWADERRLRRFSVWGLEPPERDRRLRGGKGFNPVGKPAEAVLRRLFAERPAG
ncbi:MAG: hypothetical protein D6776_03285 [Planctomycetota bacterium]|nr:MAG: hypothetical protein D6776_03285 [Planctomycetota bacterium]